MKMAVTVFKKELKDSIRDRRTMIAMVIIPLLLFPLLIGISSKFISSSVKKAKAKTLEIGLVTNGNAEDFRHMLLARDDVSVIDGIDEDKIRALIESDSLDAVLVFDENFDRQVAALKAGKVILYYKDTEKTEIEARRARAIVNDYREQLVAGRFDKLEISEEILEPLDVDRQNIASAREQIADEIGGLLPYFFIIFCFTGAMYPAIDLAAGEKERGTLETLLTSPAGRFEILLGKFGVVVLTGIFAAVVSLVGMYIGIRQIDEIPPELLDFVFSILEVKSLILLFSLLLPLTVFFAGLLLSLSLFAKSFKEAQSMINPLMIAVIVPSFIGMLPGVSLNATTAVIPILNVSLATKAIIAGTAGTGILIEVFVSQLVIAGVTLAVCAKLFGRESLVFRGL